MAITWSVSAQLGIRSGSLKVAWVVIGLVERVLCPLLALPLCLPKEEFEIVLQIFVAGGRQILWKSQNHITFVQGENFSARALLQGGHLEEAKIFSGLVFLRCVKDVHRRFRVIDGGRP